MTFRHKDNLYELTDQTIGEGGKRWDKYLIRLIINIQEKLMGIMNLLDTPWWKKKQLNIVIPISPTLNSF
ncbi:MAG: hypothetical protein GX340_04565 [Clostridiales bacterium]|nr:hypothetical protein [Clostridiales bacterium]